MHQCERCGVRLMSKSIVDWFGLTLLCTTNFRWILYGHLSRQIANIYSPNDNNIMEINENKSHSEHRSSVGRSCDQKMPSKTAMIWFPFPSIFFSCALFSCQLTAASKYRIFVCVHAACDRMEFLRNIIDLNIELIHFWIKFVTHRRVSQAAVLFH